MARVTKTELKDRAGVCPECGSPAVSVDVEGPNAENTHGARWYEGTSTDEHGHEWPFAQWLGADEVENPAIPTGQEGNVSEIAPEPEAA